MEILAQGRRIVTTAVRSIVRDDDTAPRPSALENRSDAMTRDEIVALFARRQQAWQNLDAAALAADYSDDATVDSPLAGGSRPGARRSRSSTSPTSRPFPT